MSATAVKDWKTEIRNIDKVTPLVIFSKVRFELGSAVRRKESDKDAC